MLPKIHDKNSSKDVVTYHTFTRELMSRKISENNISKLKMIKEFLQDEQCFDKVQFTESKQRKKSDFTLDRSLESKKLMRMKDEQDKENEIRFKKVHRQSVTSQSRKNATRERQSSQKQRSIFCVPDRLKLNELFPFNNSTRNKRMVIRDLLNYELKMNNQLYTHRIL